MIQVSGLTKTFPGGKKAVDALDLNIRQGEIIGLLGPNGAGKTTTIRVLSTLSGFDDGKVRVAGFDVDVDPEKVRESIGVVAQQTGVDYFLTGRENLDIQGRLYRMKKSDIQSRIQELASYFELQDSLDKQVMTYSGGMRRKLDIATALIHKPKLLFLDEPTLGLDIKSRKNLWTYIEKLNKEFGLTILLTTHYLEEADKLAHRVAIINAGKIRIVGTPEELKSSVGGDSLALTFEQQSPQTQAFAQHLIAQGYAKNSVWDGPRLHLYVQSGAESVPKIARSADEWGIAIVALTLARPSLDDVFLKYTGTSFEGTATEDGGDEWWKQWAGKGGGTGKWQQKWQETSAETTDAAPAQAVWPADGEQQQWPATGEKQTWPAAESTPSTVEPIAPPAPVEPENTAWPQQESWGKGDNESWPSQGNWKQNGSGDWDADKSDKKP